MTCPKCGQELKAGTERCPHCGAALRRRMPAPSRRAAHLPAEPGPEKRRSPAPAAPSAPRQGAPRRPRPASSQPARPAPRPTPPAPPERKKSVWRWIAPLLICIAVLLIAVAVVLIFFRGPAGLADTELTGFLPQGAAITANMTMDKKTQVVEYTYLRPCTYCDVRTSARLTFHYSDGWSPEPQEELLDEAEDWTRLAGVWTVEGSPLAIEITGFSNAAVEGTVSFTDGSGDAVPFQEVFGYGIKTADADTGGIYYRFTGAGALQGRSLRIDRDKGVLLDEDRTPMEKDAAPTQTPAPAGGLEIQREEGAPVGDGSAAEAGSSGRLIATARLNVRPGPSQDQEPLGTVDVGTELTFTSASGGWYQVEYNGQTGYVSGDYVQDLSGAAAGTVSVLSASTELNVRSGPGTDQQVLTTLQAGDKLVALGLSDGWYTVRFNAGSAYVSADYVTVLRAVN